MGALLLAIDTEKFGVVDALLVAVIAIAIVFLVLVIIIVISNALQFGMASVEKRTHILPKKENKILDEDKDAEVAALVASIEYFKETGKEPEIKSIERIED